jgi:uncharacterized membrane protein YdbT with pleckstrin-like domain
VPFPPKLLNDNEEVVLDLRPHWSKLFWPVTFLVLAIIVSIFISVKWGNTATGVGSAIICVAALVFFVFRYMRWTTTNFVVTTDRLVYRSGVVSKHGREIPLERVNDIAFHQSMFERMIGAGDLMIESAGERGQQTFSDIRRPSVVQNEIYRQMEATKARDADRMAGRRELSIPEQLDKLDDLRQRGVISQAEFDAKKAQLLDRM